MLARNEWVTSGRYAEFGAQHAPHRVFVRDAGAIEAPKIFFLHGFPSSSWDWAKVEPLLAERYRLGYLDFLGFGASSKPSRYRYSLMEQAQIAQAALGELGFDRFHLVAHDYGVWVAQQLLCEPAMRSRIASLTILNGGLYTTLDRPTLVQKVLRSRAGWLAARLLNRDRFTAAFRSTCSSRYQPSAAELDQHWEGIAENDGTLRAHELIRYVDDRLEFGEMWECALEQSDISLNFIWGMQDPIAGKKTIEYAIPRQRRFPNVTTLPDVGHYPHIEVPDRVATSISAFVDCTPG
ncbi:MAG: alpha/beta hydrolase [Candidatus Eremiobacteraeota bacterium]|nr:alpha/beta hydrolase [Candidatus Eremiobacteraeota bacterium]